MKARSIAKCAIAAGGLLLVSVVLARPAPAAEPLKLGVPPSPWAAPLPTPTNPGVQQLPAPETHTFVGPLSRSTKSGRAGIAVWGAPGNSASPRGPGDPDSVGWAGGGMAAEWGGVPRRPPSN